jgi:hypothetical protein
VSNVKNIKRRKKYKIHSKRFSSTAHIGNHGFEEKRMKK